MQYVSFDGYTTTDQVVDRLTNTIGKLVKETTGYKVINSEGTVTKPPGDFILVDVVSLEPVEYSAEEIVDDQGFSYTAHNYLASYSLMAYRGKPHIALSIVQQAFSKPYIRNKYFPLGSPFAYSSSSSVSRMRVPINQQDYEVRARIVLNFNICFLEKDLGIFEEVEKVVVGISVEQTSGPPIGIDAEIDSDSKPGGEDTPSDNEEEQQGYIDRVVETDVDTPVIGRPELISDKSEGQ